MVENSTRPRVIRDEEFARRLTLACDGSGQVPEYNRGRLTWVRQQLALRFGIKTSVETVRKWFAGEAVPRPDKMRALAEMLNVDVGWLTVGQEADMTPRERKVRNAQIDGAVNVVAGFIQMGGGHPAFPGEEDTRAADEHVDIYAIIRGARYDIHVSLAQPTADGFRFAVPVNHERLFVIGLIQKGPLCCEALEISNEAISSTSSRKGGHLELDVRRDGDRFVTGNMEIPSISGFDKRL